MKRDVARRAVDAALADAARDASRATLPPSLRARILAASRPAPAPRGRLLDFVLRATAVAAAVVAMAFVVPSSLEAAEFDATPLAEWNARIGASVSQHLGSIGAPDPFVAGSTFDAAWPLGAAAIVLVVAGLLVSRRVSA